MFCCAPPNIRKLFLFKDKTAKYHKLRTKPGLCIVYDYDVFRKNAAYLPKLHEHKIQEEPNFVINDPSSIFYDPEEKSGFVYKTSESLEDINSDMDKVRGHNTSLDSSLNLDDSLDLIPNMAPNLAEESFDQEYGIQSSRRGSSELIDSCDEATYHDYHQMDAKNTPVNLLLSSAETFKGSEIRNLRIYEDSGYGSGGQRQKKDYNSDAESTNKYQDSESMKMMCFQIPQNILPLQKWKVKASSMTLNLKWMTFFQNILSVTQHLKHQAAPHLNWLQHHPYQKYWELMRNK